MAYSVDASALIDAWEKWYSPSHHPSLWSKIEILAQKGGFNVPDLVIEELGDKDDDVYKWCKDRESIIKFESGKRVQKNVAEIVNEYKNLDQGDGQKNSADPFVIAVAMENGSTVITHENPTNNLSGPRIPDVCRDIGVEWVRFPEVFKREGWQF